MTDSRCCWQKPAQHLKAIILQFTKNLFLKNIYNDTTSLSLTKASYLRKTHLP